MTESTSESSHECVSAKNDQYLKSGHSDVESEKDIPG